MQRQLTHPVRFENGKAVEYRVERWPDKPMGDHGLHNWWYGCLARAGIVEPGTTSGERMHKARHTAGQRVLDATGNLKAAQKLLGHASISTTGDIYADRDIDQLAETMRAVLEGGSESFPPPSQESPANSDFMEAGGIEPPSAAAPTEHLRA